MYLDHFGLKEPPFSITPDPRFVFLSDRHRDALAHLIYGISQGGGGGFVQLTGEVGTGKTTLSRLLLEQLPENTRVALVLNPRLSPVELLEAICEELHLDIAAARGSGKALVDALNRFLIEAYGQGLRIVLILDEAQQLSIDALEQVRLLTNLETHTQKLLQIVLLGQPELRELLDRPELRQLAQRITARYHLTPLTADETEAYARHRLAVAGLARAPFTASAFKALHHRSGGIPRLINVIAERALIAGYARDATRLDARLVNAAADELQNRPHAALPNRRRWMWAAAGAAALTIGAATVYLLDRAPPAAPALAGAEPVAERPSALADLLPGDAAADLAADRALLERWQADPALAPRVADCPFQLAGELYCLRSRGTLAQLAALDRPVLLVLPRNGVARRLALVGIDAAGARVAGAAGEAVLPRAELESAWPGEYLTVAQLPGRIGAIVADALPDWAQAALARFEMNRALPPLSDLDARVRRLQQAHGLRADGVVGPETWWALSAYRTDGPRLAAPAPAAANR